MFRTLGGTIGVAIGQAIYSSFLQKNIAKIPNLDFDTSPSALADSVNQLKNIAVSLLPTIASSAM